MKRKRDTAKAKVKLRGFKRSRTLAVTEYGKDGEPKPKLYPLPDHPDWEQDNSKGWTLTQDGWMLSPESNMPTVDELVEIGKNGMTAKQAAEYQAWMAKQAADLQVIGVDFSSDSFDSFTFAMQQYSGEKAQFLSGHPKPASDIRPKKVPTYETKPRKIDLE